MSESPEVETSPVADSADVAWRREGERKQRILLSMYAYAFIAGMLAGATPDEDRNFDLVLGFPWLVLGIAWCLSDSRQRGRRMTLLMRTCLVLLFVFVFPIYIFSTRGAIRGLRTFAAAIGFVAMLYTSMWASALVTSIIVWLVHHR